MLPHITDVRYVGAFTVWLRFSDGSQGDLDLSQDLDGPMFEPLRNRVFFSHVQLHPELRTLTWPNGADFAPEFLRARLKVAA